MLANAYKDIRSIYPACALSHATSLMIIDTLTIAGILASAFYLLTFAWFGKETLKVEEATPDREASLKGGTEAPCADY